MTTLVVNVNILTMDKIKKFIIIKKGKYIGTKYKLISEFDYDKYTIGYKQSITDKLKLISETPNQQKEIIETINLMQGKKIGKKELTLLSKIVTAINNNSAFRVLPDDYIPKDKRRFFKMYVDNLFEIVSELNKVNEIKLLVALTKEHNDRKGEVCVPTAKLSRMLNIDKSGISRAYKGLIEKGIIKIKKESANDATKTYTFSEDYFKYGR